MPGEQALRLGSLLDFTATSALKQLLPSSKTNSRCQNRRALSSPHLPGFPRCACHRYSLLLGLHAPPLLASCPSPALLFMALSWAPLTLWCAQNAVRSHCSLTPPTRLSSTAGAGSPNVPVCTYPSNFRRKTQLSGGPPHQGILYNCLLVCWQVGCKQLVGKGSSTSGL